MLNILIKIQATKCITIATPTAKPKPFNFSGVKSIKNEFIITQGIIK